MSGFDVHMAAVLSYHAYDRFTICPVTPGANLTANERRDMNDPFAKSNPISVERIRQAAETLEGVYQGGLFHRVEGTTAFGTAAIQLNKLVVTIELEEMEKAAEKAKKDAEVALVEELAKTIRSGNPGASGCVGWARVGEEVRNNYRSEARSVLEHYDVTPKASS